MAVPFWVAGFGLLSALVGKLVVSSVDSGANFAARHRSLTAGLRAGLYTTVLLTLALSAVTIGILYPLSFPYYLREKNQDLISFLGTHSEGWKLFAVCCIGLATGLAAWESTAFFTSHRCGPTRSVAASGASGVATHLIQGLGVGLLSCLPTAVLLAVDVIGCHAIAGQYGVALSAVATAAPLAFALTADALSPVAYAAGSMVCGSDAPQVRAGLLDPGWIRSAAILTPVWPHKCAEDPTTLLLAA
jgi:K(+)-stimulated pyrophosphate-energized sodium pump